MRKMLARGAVTAAIVSAGMVAAAGTAVAAPSDKLQTFGTGDVTVSQDGTVNIVNDAGEYGGVYVKSKSNSGKSLSQADFSFTNNGGDVAGGAPRFSIPIDTDNNGKTDNGYAFIDVAGCGGATGDNTVVSTDNANCQVNFNGVSYANWDAFAAANPTYRIDPGSIPFVIADVQGSYSVTDISLR
jgi:hypothetical protein